VKTEDSDDGSDAEMGATVSDDRVCVDVDEEGNKLEAADGNSNKNETNDCQGDLDGDGDLDFHADAGDIGVEEGTDQSDPTGKDIHEDTRPLGSTVITGDAVGVEIDRENECAVQVPDDKSSADTYPSHATTEINGGNPPSPGLPGLSPTIASSPTAPTTDINGGNPPSPGLPGLSPTSSPTAPTTDINGGNPPSRASPGLPGLRLSPTSSPTAPTTDTNRGNSLFPGASPTVTALTMGINRENANPVALPLFHPTSPTVAALTMGINRENANPVALPLQVFHPTRFNFPEEPHGTHIQSNPYSYDFTVTSGFPAHSASTPSLNPSTDFGFGHTEYNLTFPQGAQLLYCSASVT
jgi:hypothetical protein